MKKLDADVKVLRACIRAIDKSSSERMVKANVEFLYNRYVRNGNNILDAARRRGQN